MKTLTYNNKRGQTLVIAIMVMFILAVIAAVFIAMVARNLFRSQRYSNVDGVTQLAEAGVRYADLMLTSSEAGADWRPAPDNLGVTNIPNPQSGPNYAEPISAADLLTIQGQNPDYQWTRPYWPTEYPVRIRARRRLRRPNRRLHHIQHRSRPVSAEDIIQPEPF